MIIITPTDRPALYSAFLRSVSFVLASSLSRILRFFQAKNVSSVTFVWLAPKAARSRSIKSSRDISSFLSSFFLSCQQVKYQLASTRSWLIVCPKWHLLLPFWAQIQVAVHVDIYKWYHWGTPKTNHTCFSRQHSRRTYKSVNIAENHLDFQTQLLPVNKTYNFSFNFLVSFCMLFVHNFFQFFLIPVLRCSFFTFLTNIHIQGSFSILALNIQIMWKLAFITLSTAS